MVPFTVSLKLRRSVPDLSLSFGESIGTNSRMESLGLRLAYRSLAGVSSGGGGGSEGEGRGSG